MFDVQKKIAEEVLLCDKIDTVSCLFALDITLKSHNNIYFVGLVLQRAAYDAHPK